MSEEKSENINLTSKQKNSKGVTKNSTKTKYLTIVSIICGFLAVVFLDIDLFSNNINIAPIFGVVSTFFAGAACIIGFVDIVYLFNDGLFKKWNFLKFLLLLIASFVLLQAALFSYYFFKETY